MSFGGPSQPIGEIPFLHALDAVEQAALRAASVPRRYEPDGTIFREGDRSDHVVIVTKGRVKIATLRPGVGEVLLAERGPGDLLGELSAIDLLPRSADAIALDEVTTLMLPNEDFKAYLQNHAGVAFVLLQTLAYRLRIADRRHVEFGESDAVERVGRGLWRLLDEVGEDAGPWRMIPLSDSEIASQLHVTVAEISNALALLEEEGILEHHRRGVTVIDIDALERLAEH